MGTYEFSRLLGERCWGRGAAALRSYGFQRILVTPDSENREADCAR